MIDDALNLTDPDESAALPVSVGVAGGPAGPGGPGGPGGPRGPVGPGGPRLSDDKRLRSAHRISTTITFTQRMIK